MCSLISAHASLEPVGQLQPMMGRVSTAALLLLLVTSVLSNYRRLIGVIGTGGIIAALVLIGGGFIIGYLLGGPGSDTRGVLGLGTGQRNISAALLVGTRNFTDPNVLAMALVGSTVGLFVPFPIVAELGKRAEKHEKQTAAGMAEGAPGGAPDTLAAQDMRAAS